MATKRFLVVVIAVVIGLSAVTAKAQTPYLQVYFDYYWTETLKDGCPPGPPGTVFDTLYVVAHNWNQYMTGFEYQIIYPPEIVFITDLTDECQVKIGTSETGLTIAWRWQPFLPPFCSWPNGIDAFLVHRVFVLWNCEGCTSGQLDIPVVWYDGFQPSVPPYDYDIQGTASELPNGGFPTPFLIDGVGLTAIVCYENPVAESTWGSIKALYRD
jgi:hypothetical protein